MANDELIPYPDGETQGRISVFETNQQEFPWQHDDYDRPDPEDLLVYELLIRDFVDQHDYKTVMDTLDYLERLGINAIELMPIMEFENNDSWGYNPSFHLAPDKYYGPKDDLKAFIDECHRRGIAVILDMVLNHAFGQSPLAQLYFDGGKPTEESPWFNIDPTHPFNVGYDFNHEKPATQEFVDRVNRFWLEEYHFDGYRFDLIKGFTQNEGGNSTDNNSAYDQSRVDIVTRMANKIWEFDPDAYVILEAFLDNSEESVYQDLGMMPWGSEHFTFKDAMIGNIQRSNFGGLYAGNRGRNSDLMVGYFESHDEERMMYEGINFGASGDSYNIQDTVTSLNRIKLLVSWAMTMSSTMTVWVESLFVGTTCKTQKD